ncbi:MAG: extracellular solute-binding protein [Chloroflexota bacterium]
MKPFMSRGRAVGATGGLIIAAAALAPGLAVAQDATWSQDHAGTTLNVIGEATLNTQILTDLLPDFTEKTGINVNIEQAPYDNLVQKVTLDASTNQGQYDVVSLPYEFLGAFATNNWISPVDDRLADTGSFQPGFDPAAVIPALQTASSVWAGKTYGAPSNSAVMMMFYRKDLFENADEQAAFKAKYGYDLAVPQTWQQYQDAAEFFTRKAGDKLAGETLTADFSGVAMTGKRHVATVLEWMDYGWTFGGGILDDQGNLVIDSPESVKALEYMVGLTKFAQPGYANATWDETTAALQQGIAAESITWGDTAGAMEAADQSQVEGKMGYASIPVLNAGDANIAHLGSWTYTLPAAGAQQDAAWEFIQWAMSKDVQTEMAKRGGLPALTSTFEDPELQASLPYWSQELTSLSEAKSRPRIPEWGAMSDILQQHISDAISGQAAPADALAAAKTELEAILTLPVTQQ